jgi:hypothetical protein
MAVWMWSSFLLLAAEPPAAAAATDATAATAAPPVEDAGVVRLVVPVGEPVDAVRRRVGEHPGGVSLAFAGAGWGWTADDVEAFVYRAIEARNLRSLDLHGQPVGLGGAKAIAASPHLGALRALDLVGCDIAEAGARALAYSPGLGALERLRVDATVGARGLAALKERYGARVEVVEPPR